MTYSPMVEKKVLPRNVSETGKLFFSKVSRTHNMYVSAAVFFKLTAPAALLWCMTVKQAGTGLCIIYICMYI